MGGRSGCWSLAQRPRCPPRLCFRWDASPSCNARDVRLFSASAGVLVPRATPGMSASSLRPLGCWSVALRLRCPRLLCVRWDASPSCNARDVCLVSASAGMLVPRATPEMSASSLRPLGCWSLALRLRCLPLLCVRWGAEMSASSLRPLGCWSVAQRRRCLPPLRPLGCWASAVGPRRVGCGAGNCRPRPCGLGPGKPVPQPRPPPSTMRLSGRSLLGVPAQVIQSWWAARVRAMWRRWRDSTTSGKFCAVGSRTTT